MEGTSFIIMTNILWDFFFYINNIPEQYSVFFFFLRAFIIVSTIIICFGTWKSSE